VNEAWWAAGGAIVLIASGLLPASAAIRALARGGQVYLFLVGMMALAEFARDEGVFDWIASYALRAARGSRANLLGLVYAAGILTTAFLSNDATVVVLTPAVLAALTRSDAAPEPYVFACALVANAASTLLPIANPSNLLFFADGMPPLRTWLAGFGLASLAALALTYGALLLVFRNALRGELHVDHKHIPPPRPLAGALLVVAALALVATAERSGPLGTVAFALALAAALAGATRDRRSPLAIARGIAWSVVVLTAGLFVLVETLDAAGAGSLPHTVFTWAAHVPRATAQLGVAAATAFASNVVNNLPVGLELGKYVGAAHPPATLNAAALIGVNVGPNFSVTGSLATVLWLAILRRAGLQISALRFAAVGAVATPLALGAAALLAR
jgi:arsenical pump membrane protein